MIFPPQRSKLTLLHRWTPRCQRPSTPLVSEAGGGGGRNFVEAKFAKQVHFFFFLNGYLGWGVQQNLMFPQATYSTATVPISFNWAWRQLPTHSDSGAPCTPHLSLQYPGLNGPRLLSTGWCAFWARASQKAEGPSCCSVGWRVRLSLDELSRPTWSFPVLGICGPHASASLG